MEIKRICLWSGPRNVSTALMYSFAQRGDTKVVDEPLYGYYLKHTNASEYHPGAQEIIDNMENDGEKVIRKMLSKNEKPVLFFKHMTHHLHELDLDFLDQVINVILTRDPRDMLPSYAKVIKSPTMKDVGYTDHLRLLEELQKRDLQPIVLTSSRLLSDPEKILRKLCASFGIPFDRAMLSWKSGPRVEDGVWAKYWYHNVHNSTGFSEYKKSDKPFPADLLPLMDACKPIYEKLLRFTL